MTERAGIFREQGKLDAASQLGLAAYYLATERPPSDPGRLEASLRLLIGIAEDRGDCQGYLSFTSELIEILAPRDPDTILALEARLVRKLLEYGRIDEARQHGMRGLELATKHKSNDLQLEFYTLLVRVGELNGEPDLCRASFEQAHQLAERLGSDTQRDLYLEEAAFNLRFAALVTAARGRDAAAGEIERADIALRDAAERQREFEEIAGASPDARIPLTRARIALAQGGEETQLLAALSARERLPFESYLEGLVDLFRGYPPNVFDRALQKLQHQAQDRFGRLHPQVVELELTRIRCWRAAAELDRAHLAGLHHRAIELVNSFVMADDWRKLDQATRNDRYSLQDNPTAYIRACIELWSLPAAPDSNPHLIEHAAKILGRSTKNSVLPARLLELAGVSYLHLIDTSGREPPVVELRRPLEQVLEALADRTAQNPGPFLRLIWLYAEATSRWDSLPVATAKLLEATDYVRHSPENRLILLAAGVSATDQAHLSPEVRRALAATYYRSAAHRSVPFESDWYLGGARRLLDSGTTWGVRILLGQAYQAWIEELQEGERPSPIAPICLAYYLLNEGQGQNRPVIRGILSSLRDHRRHYQGAERLRISLASGVIYQELGDYQRAERMYDSAARLAELDSNPIAVAVVADRRARLFGLQGRGVGAEAAVRRAEDYLKSCPPGGPVTRSMELLSGTASQVTPRSPQDRGWSLPYELPSLEPRSATQDRNDAALYWIARPSLIDLVEKVSSAAPRAIRSDVLRQTLEQGFTLETQGLYSQAFAEYGSAYIQGLKLFGGGHPALLSPSLGQVRCLVQDQRYGDAETVLNRVQTSIRRISRGAAHPYAATVACYRSEILIRSERLPEAFSALRRAINLVERRAAPGAPLVSELLQKQLGVAVRLNWKTVASDIQQRIDGYRRDR